MQVFLIKLTGIFYANFDDDYPPPPSLQVVTKVELKYHQSSLCSSVLPYFECLAYMAFHHSFFGSCMGGREPGNEPTPLPKIWMVTLFISGLKMTWLLHTVQPEILAVN